VKPRLRFWRSPVYWAVFVAAWIATGFPPTVTVSKGAGYVVGRFPLIQAYPAFAWDFIAFHLLVSGLLALAVWGAVLLAGRLAVGRR
jgi:hypothetical protein